MNSVPGSSVLNVVSLCPRLGLRVQFDLIGTFADIVENNARLAAGAVVR